MISIKKTDRTLKLGIISGLAIITGLSLTLGAPKPAAADSSFSFSISTDAFHIGYRSTDDGGYRYWTPGCYDRHNHWHDGYFSGPVVYAPDAIYYGNDGYRNNGEQYRHDFGRDGDRNGRWNDPQNGRSEWNSGNNQQRFDSRIDQGDNNRSNGEGQDYQGYNDRSYGGGRNGQGNDNRFDGGGQPFNGGGGYGHDNGNYDRNDSH